MPVNKCAHSVKNFTFFRKKNKTLPHSHFVTTPAQNVLGNKNDVPGLWRGEKWSRLHGRLSINQSTMGRVIKQRSFQSYSRHHGGACRLPRCWKRDLGAITTAEHGNGSQSSPQCTNIMWCYYQISWSSFGLLQSKLTEPSVQRVGSCEWCATILFWFIRAQNYLLQWVLTHKTLKKKNSY